MTMPHSGSGWCAVKRVTPPPAVFRLYAHYSAIPSVETTYNLLTGMRRNDDSCPETTPGALTGQSWWAWLSMSVAGADPRSRGRRTRRRSGDGAGLTPIVGDPTAWTESL